MAGQKAGRMRTHDEGSNIRALERGLAVLEALAMVDALSLSELARRVQLSTSTTSRVLETLRRRRFVTQTDDGLYRIGIRAFEVGAAYLQGTELHRAARPVMKTLAEALEETVNLAVLDSQEVVYVDQEVAGRSMVRMFTQIGARAPLYCTGAGKALLAWLPESEVRKRLGDEPLAPHTPHTLISKEAVVTQLRRIREQGYAFDDEEREVGVRCVAVPIRNQFGEVTATLSLSAPVSRLPDDKVKPLADALVRSADDISLRLGWAMRTIS